MIFDYFCITKTDPNIFKDVWPLTGTCSHHLRTLDGSKAKSLQSICTFLKSITELPFTSYFWKTSGVAVTPNSVSGVSIATSLNTWAASLSKLCRRGREHGVTSTHRWLHDLMLASTEGQTSKNPTTVMLWASMNWAAESADSRASAPAPVRRFIHWIIPVVVLLPAEKRSI